MYQACVLVCVCARVCDCVYVYASCECCLEKVYTPALHPPLQRYQEVPATPLVSLQVLQDEKETWGDMQVGGVGRWGRWVE